MPTKASMSQFEIPESVDYRNGYLIATYKRWHDGKLVVTIPIPDDVKEKIRKEKLP